MIRKITILLIKLTIAGGLVALLVSQGGLELGALRDALRHPWVILSVILLISGTFSLAAYRWYLLITSQHTHLSLTRVAQITFIGLFFNAFLPGGGIGGDALRIAYVTKATPLQRTPSVISIFVDRVLGIYGLVTLSILVALANIEAVTANPSLLYLALLSLGIFLGAPVTLTVFYRLFRTNTRIHEFMLAKHKGTFQQVLQRALEAINIYRKQGVRIILPLALSVLSQGLSLLALVMLAVHMETGSLGPLEYAFAAPWGWVASIIPITPGGLGVGEVAFDRICHWIEPTPSVAAYATIFLAFRILAIVATIPGFIAYLIYRHEIQEALHLAEEQNG